jgi:hypothetical protein
VFAWTLTAPFCFACEGEPLPAHIIDLPLEVSDDGSFRYAGEVDNSINGRFLWGEVGGNPIVDIGNGRVGQKLFAYGACLQVEKLLFVDCSNDVLVLFYGEGSDGLGGGWLSSISAIQAPDGPIRLSATSTVEQLEGVAKANKISFTRDLIKIVDASKERNRFDPWNGCKIFYPDSLGAKM